ncbi:HNH endonuclease [Streptomyces purpureus]|uniref:HNH endonuclease n=1 Tax=Streptomyces purpureus TaxID=1951 RepID=UPI001FD52FC4|nr:HNH endonuclease signature motif containing protein [Streptomyces purpureus]
MVRLVLGRLPRGRVDVDHVRPLSLGGEDIDSNVQVLCHGCHQLKTRTEFGTARADKTPAPVAGTPLAA